MRESHEESSSKTTGNAVEAALRKRFTAEVVDELREKTGYNPHQRLVTRQCLMLVVVERSC